MEGGGRKGGRKEEKKDREMEMEGRGITRGGGIGIGREGEGERESERDLRKGDGGSQKRKHTFPVFSNEQVNKTHVCYAILSMHSTFNDETRHKQAYYAWFKYEKAIFCCSCFL
jgi:hypothetical protein